MIKLSSGNLLAAPAEALVNTVNTEGVMGKGIALQFKNMFPVMFKEYVDACKVGAVKLGKMDLHHLSSIGDGPQWIVNFPTKGHWRAKSRIKDIEAGLESLVQDIQRLGIKSIAVPPLGCGNGGLEWSEVRPIIESAFAAIPEVEVLLYAPGSTPQAKDMPNRTERPKMTVAMATLVAMIDRYRQALMDPFVTVLEAQKLMYFLQEAGENLKLNYTKHHFGPYAVNLRHVLNRMESHYLVGFGDGEDKPTKPLTLLENSRELSARTLERNFDVQERMNRVSELIDGFEDTFGMELLSTVHWVMCHVPDADSSSEVAVEAVQSWNLRKSKTMRPIHIQKAWMHLRDHNWHRESRSAQRQ